MNTITHEILDELCHEDTLTISRKKAINKLIDGKVAEIFHSIIELTKGAYNWFAYSNDIEYGDGNGSSGGEFDINKYKNFISLTGDFNFKDKYSRNNLNIAFPFQKGFPTYLITLENPEKEIEKILYEYYDKCEKEIQKNNDTESKKKLKKEEIISAIKKKLTIEELKYIKFK